MIAFWAGWPHEAIRYSGLAEDLAHHVRGTSSVWPHAQRARAWALLGNTARTSEAIRQATAARDSVVDDELDKLGGIMAFPVARQKYYAADA